MDTRYKRLGVNTILVLLGKAGSALIGLLLLPYYTSMLSTADYGTTDMVTTYSNMLVAFMGCCIYDAIFIFAKDVSEDERRKLFSSGVFFILGSAAVFSIAAFVLSFLSDKLNWEGVFFSKIWFIVALSMFSALQMYMQSFTQGVNKMKVYSTTGIVFSLSMAITSIAMIPFWGVDGYILSFVVSNLLATLYSFFASKFYVYFKFSYFDKNKLKLLLYYGVPIIPNGIMWWLVSGINRPIMEHILGLSAVGLFAVANKIPAAISMLSGVFNSAWSISMLEEFRSNDFNVFFNKTIKRLFFVIIIVGIGLVIFSELIVTLIASDEYIDAWRIVPFLIFSVICQVMSGLIGGVFAAQKKSKYFFYSSIWGALSSLICTYVFTLWFGLFGVAFAMIVSFLVMVGARLKYAWKYINLFDIKYYVLMSCLFLLISAVCVLDVNFGWKWLAYVVVSFIVLMLNKGDLIFIFNIIKTKKNKFK